MLSRRYGSRGVSDRKRQLVPEKRKRSATNEKSDPGEYRALKCGNESGMRNSPIGKPSPCPGSIGSDPALTHQAVAQLCWPVEPAWEPASAVLDFAPAVATR